MECSLSLTFTIDNGVAQYADGSSLWNLDDDESDSEYDDDDALSIGGEEVVVQSDEDLRDLMMADGSLLWNLDDESGSDDDDDDALSIGGEEIVVQSDEDLWDLMTTRSARRRGGGGEEGAAVFVPASGAAVAGLEKQSFHATSKGYDCAVTGCAICLENFKDGEEVTVMPCSRGHEFHPDCIRKWLGKSNTCPLCSHALPTDVIMDDDADM